MKVSSPVRESIMTIEDKENAFNCLIFFDVDDYS
jgi:hypothetical protein